MHTNRQTFWNHPPAPAARLGRVGRVHGNDLDTSTFSLVFKHLPKLSKPGIMRGERQVSVAVHEIEGEVFDSDQVILSHKACADLVKIIRSLISHLFVQAGNTPVGFSLAAAPLHLSRSVTLQAAQFRQVIPQPMWIFNQLTRRKSSQTVQANVNANLSASLGKTFFRIGQFEHQANVPLFANPLDDRVLDNRPVRDSSVVAHPHFAHALHVERSTPMYILAQLASITVGVFNAIETAATFETRKARLFPRLQTAKEGSKRLIQASQEVLQAGCVDLPQRIGVISAHISKVRPLRSVTNPLPRLSIGSDPLLEGGIVSQPGLPEQKVQLFRLLAIRAKEVLVRAKHNLTRLLHLDISLDSFLGDVTDWAHVVASTPHVRQSGTQLGKLLAQYPGCIPLELVGKALGRFIRVALDEQVNVVGHDFKRLNHYIQFLSFLIQQGAQFLGNLADQHFAAVCGTPNEVILQRVNTACIPTIPCVDHRTSVLRHSVFVNYLHERRERLPLLPEGNSPRR
jgi:hypothetical protein